MTLPREGELRASVVIPVHNGEATLGGCLEALSRQTAPPGSFEVIVVDDGSTDGSGQIAAQFEPRLLSQEQGGAAAARNLGARHAGGEILLFTDADCEPLPDWVEKMLAPFSEAAVVGVKGIYKTRQQSLVARFTQAEYEEKYDKLARCASIDFVDTHAAAYRREVFAQSGGFDPAFIFDEDQELSFRLAQAGHRLVFAPQARVYHEHPDTVGKYLRRKIRLGRWKVRVHLRYPSRALANTYTPTTQKVQLALLPLAMVAAVAAAIHWLPWWVVWGLALVGLLSTVPLTVKATRHGWKTAVAAPGLALLRALALDVGLAWGLASPWRRQTYPE